MRFAAACLLASVLALPSRAQTITPEASGDAEIFEVVETRPELIGGLEELQQRVEYPEMARRAGMEGKVFVQFVVNEDGSVSDVRSVRCTNELLCEAGMQAVRESRFTPGMNQGVPVRVRFTLPIDFKLRDSGPVQPGTVRTSGLINGVLGTDWDAAGMEGLVGAPLFGAVEDGNGRLQYADADPEVERVTLIVRDGVMHGFEADFIGPDAVANLTTMKASIAAEAGPPADGKAFSPEQLGVARRFTIWPEQRRVLLEYAPLAPEPAE